jgi:hypothetical protein
LSHNVTHYLLGHLDAIKEKPSNGLEESDFFIEDDWNADIASVEVASINKVDFDVIELGNTRAEVEGFAEVTIEVEATVGDYNNSPVEGGECVIVYQNVVRIKAVREVRFDMTVRLRRQQGIPKPVKFETPYITEPKHFELKMEADDVKVIRSWEDDASEE